MAKALVIKGANFSTNKLTTIDFSESVPCTALSLSQSTASITGYSSVTVTATKTPENTTDQLFWNTSDSSVATVEGGVITPVGMGACTITATCGEQTATVAVTVAFAYITNYNFAQISYNSGSGIIGYTAPDYNYLLAHGKDNQKTEKQIALASGTAISGNVYGIKLPAGATKVKLSITDTSGIYNNQWSGGFQWLKDEAVDGSHPNVIKRVSGQFINLKTETNLTFSVPEGADSFVFNIHLASSASSGDNPATIISGMGFGIEFLTE